MKINTQIYFVVICTILVAVTFQNCSDVNISGQPSIASAPLIVASAKPVDKLCAPKGAVFGSPVRIVIILDMSMSNIGSVNTYYFDYLGGLPFYSIDTNDGPTDLNGARFDQVKNFIDNCGGNVNVKYAILGFSKAAQFARGQSCLSPFESQENALKTVEAFRQQQNSDKAMGSGIGTYPFYLGDKTRYDFAVTCMGQKIQEDLTLLISERPEYHVFFLTDGLPDGDTSSLTAQINNILLATRGSASGMHFNSVFYTSPGAKNQSQVAAAKAVLDPMTQVTEGPSAQTIVLNDLSTAQAQFCSKLQPTSMVNYSLKTMYAVNLTTLMDKNNIVADSDMDGVSDEVEKSLSWDPVNYRSTGVLDGLCKLTGNDKSVCASKLAALTCSNNNFIFGMSECDRAFATKIFGRALTNLDVDQDLVPNFIEILKGTSPLRDDMFENPSSDGIVNIEKISQGMDVQSSTSLWPIEKEKLMKMSYNADVGVCADTGTKRIDYSLDNIPLAEVLAYVDPSDDAAIKLSHLKDENVIVVLSVWQAIGGVPLPNRLYVQKWIVPIKGEPKSEAPQFLGEF